MTILRACLLPALFACVGCGGGNGEASVDASIDSGSGCDPAALLPTAYRPIAMVSTGAVQVSTTAGLTSGTIDATAGGLANSADRPYVYVDLRNGVKIEVDDLAARSSMTWDLALKRSSLRINGGDSGPGARKLAVMPAATLAEVTAAPNSGYMTDDFTTPDCMLDTLPGGEPKSAFGEWYNYDAQTHAVSPKSEVYVIERNNGSRTAFRVISYNGDTAMPMRGAYYSVEWKQLQ